MSTPEQPATPALTRKQLRDIRNTGATPIVTGDAPPADEQPPVEPEIADADQAHDDADEVADPDVDAHAEATAEPAPPAPVADSPAPPVAAPLPRAAVPVPVHDLPGADASVDLGVAPLTRRQARQQERIRTASVPVITPEVAAAHAASLATAAPVPAVEPAQEDVSSAELSLAQLFGSDAPSRASDDTPEVEAVVEESDSDHETELDHVSPEPQAEPVAAAEADRGEDEADRDEAGRDEADRAVVRPEFGAELLAGETPAVELPPSFDQLISRSMTGSVGTGNALILSQTPAASPLVAPVTATGEVLITGSFNLPEGLGSTGHAAGTADGKETDAVLVDGELPAHSSPTPIAASAAISTVKNGGDLIKPPTPEKGGRLMLTLAITAGVLALALVGVLILAFVTGVF